jgi:small subunit ribosomal protein S2
VKKLNDAGVFHYWQIAALTPEETTKLDHDLKLGGRIERDGWTAQAKSLTAAE